MVGELVVEKSIKLTHFGAISFTKYLYDSKKPQKHNNVLLQQKFFMQNYKHKIVRKDLVILVTNPIEASSFQN